MKNLKTFLLLSACMVSVPYAWAREPLVVFFIDPSYDRYSGDAMLVCTPGGRHYVIDGGMMNAGYPSWDCGEERILPILDSLGVTLVDGVVGTHPDADHVGGLISVYRSMPVGTAYDSGWPYGGTWIYRNYLEAIWDNGANFVTPRRGDVLNWGPELQVEVLHPTKRLSQSNTNNASLVIRLTYGETTFLFTGDLETEGGEDAVLAALGTGEIKNISADVLKIAHHGSASSTCPQWLDAVNPAIAAICVGSGNPYGHPSKEILQLLEANGVEVCRTDLIGTFYISTDGKNIYVNEMPPEGSGRADDFIVYPSPAVSTVNFASDAGSDRVREISVYNLNGERVMYVENPGELHTWDLRVPGGFASPGLYAAVFTTYGGESCRVYFTICR